MHYINFKYKATAATLAFYKLRHFRSNYFYDFRRFPLESRPTILLLSNGLLSGEQFSEA